MRLLNKVLSITLLIAITMIFVGCTNDDVQTNHGSESNFKGINEPIYQYSELIDLDLDGEDEFIVHEMMDGFGGVGQYRLVVYEKDNYDNYVKIFDSNEFFVQTENSGLIARPIRDGVYAIEHQASGYYMEYEASEEVYPYLFDEKGVSTEEPMFTVDSFSHFEIKPGDEYESVALVFHQYMSIGWHGNYIGDCITVWKLQDSELILTDLYVVK